MKFSAKQRQRILEQCARRDTNDSICAVSRRYGLASNGQTLLRWMRQWNGTTESLREREHPGRPRILTRTQVHNSIRQPVIAANRAHRCINYSMIHRQLQQEHHLDVSVRTVRRYGRRDVGIRNRRVQRKTPHERNHTRTRT